MDAVVWAWLVELLLGVSELEEEEVVGATRQEQAELTRLGMPWQFSK